MRILLTSTSYAPVIGGGQLHAHRLAVELAARHSVRVVTHWDTYRTDWLLGTTLAAPSRPRDYEVDGVPVHRLGFSLREKAAIAASTLSYYALQGVALRHLAGRLADKLEHLVGDVDVVHNVRIGREPLSFASLELARRRGVPFVFSPLHHQRWRGFRYRHYLSLYRDADRVIALTRAEKRLLTEVGVAERRIEVAGTGAVLAGDACAERFRARHRVAGPIVLFLGQKFRFKNFDALLASAPLVWARRPETSFVFVGPPTRFSSQLFAGVTDPRVVELPTVDVEEKTDALAACDMLCLPSSQESFGAVFVEAWLMGKPVIGARIPAVAEVISDGRDGLLAEPSPRALAERVLFLLDNPAERQRMGAAGREKALGVYSWERIAATVEGAYRDALRGE